MTESFKKIIRFFQIKAAEPRPYGIYHILCLGILGVLLFAIVSNGRYLRHNKKTVRRLTAYLGALLLAAEILKQIFSSAHIDGDGGIYWKYPWHIFPFQVCSTPLYACIALLFCPEGDLRRALCCYLGTFGIFGGIVVMLGPASVYIDALFINIHTMLWHAGLILLDALQWCGGEISAEAENWSGGVLVFLFFLIVACILNFSLPQYADENFNMFYISPYVSPDSSPLFVFAWKNIPYPLYLLCYTVGFIAISGALYAALQKYTRKTFCPLKSLT